MLKSVTTCTKESALQLLSNSRKLTVKVNEEDCESLHFKIMGSSHWTTDGISVKDHEDNGSLDEESFADLLAYISTDCISYNFKFE